MGLLFGISPLKRGIGKSQVVAGVNLGMRRQYRDFADVPQPFVQRAEAVHA